MARLLTSFLIEAHPGHDNVVGAVVLRKGR
jgi:hypothetical protein